jgi:hypothetical protein
VTRRLAATGLLLIVSLLATGNWLYFHPPLGRDPQALFQGMIDGTAYKPHVTRALVPFVVRGIEGLLPSGAAEGLRRPLVWAGLKPVLLPDTHPEIRPVSFYVWVYLVIASLALLGEGTRRFLASLYAGSSWLFLVGGALTIALWPLLACYSAYVYDPFTPTLVLWAFLAGAQRKWIAYYPLLALAAINKETTVLVPLAVSLALTEAVAWRSTLKRTLFDVGIIASIRAILTLVVFRGNPGSLLEFHMFGHNVNYVIAYLFLPQFALIAILVAGLCAPDWRRKPRAAKALALLVVPLAAAALLFGYVDELRQYAETLPGFVALIFPTVLSQCGIDCYRPRPREG